MGEQNPEQIEFLWEATSGATEYVVEIHARDPLLGGIPLFRSQPLTQPSGQGRITYLYYVRQPGFIALQPDTDYYWRVGARNNHPSEVRPQPLGYVFTAHFPFHTASAPPPGT
jgi:hypothetical protein